ncbi:WD40-repeat-containing domain protein [Aspergillus aurantiobrunneus]
MSTNHSSSPVRLAKRTRASNAALNDMHSKREGTKRRRISAEEHDDAPLKMPNALEVTQKPSCYNTTSASTEGIIDKDVSRPSDSWTMSRSIAGLFTNLDPILTPDEQYLFLGLEAAIHVYSVANSRLFRVLEVDSGDSLIGYRLSPINHERLYFFTLSGSVSEWDWPSNKQIAHWNTAHKMTSADLLYNTLANDATNDATNDAIDAIGAHNVLFSLRERKDGKRALAITPLNTEKPQGTIILETQINIHDFRIIGSGQAVVAYGGARIFFGSSCSTSNHEPPKYAWREVKLAATITCIDIQQNRPHVSDIKKIPEFDLALGGVDGSVLIYHDALGFLGISGREDKKPAPRRLHWHRDPVTAVRWSKDGNYVLSGGHESVMVLWQLDTGRKQFLPHLSSSIRNIVVSGSGNSYVVKLADNRVMVLSARELLPFATITSLQLCTRTSGATDQVPTNAPHVPRLAVAAMHPQRSDQLLITVPASHQLTQEGVTSISASVLQTYDIRSGAHISRQALARTNATTLNISPDGTQILTPDIKHLGISEDGTWMATIDSWSSCFEDIATLNKGRGVHSGLEEIYLKFWRWNESSSLWQLVTRIDSPHLSDNGPVPVLEIASRPNNHEFATIGSDGLLRFWRPVTRQRHVLKGDGVQAPESWKCRNTLDLRGYIETCDVNSTGLSSASACFSEDGSVLAASLQSTTTNIGLTILIDVRSCSVRYSKAGVYSGDICGAAFLGCYILIATKLSVFVWDTVNDVVRTIESPEVLLMGGSGSCLLAVNPRTQTFATASKSPQKTGMNKLRKSGFVLQVYNISSLELLSCFKLAKEPVALLSSSVSTEYVVVDAGANIRQICCATKAPRVGYADKLVQYPDFGLESLFGRQCKGTANRHSTSAAAASLNAQPLEGKGLANVFGDTPPSVLPPSHLVFRDLVKALSA